MTKTKQKLCVRQSPKLQFDINADDIEDFHRVKNKDQTIIKFRKRKVSRQAISVRKNLNKVKMSDIHLTE